MEIENSGRQWQGKPAGQTPSPLRDSGASQAAVNWETSLRQAKLRARISDLCGESYKWNSRSYAEGIASKGGRSACQFQRQPGNFRRRLDPLIWLPINCVLIFLFFSWIFVLFILAVVVAGAAYLAPIYSPDFVEGAKAVALSFIYWGSVAAGCLGLVVGSVIAIFPEYSSGRAFGFLDEKTGCVTVIFCGSLFFENLTINALVLPLFAPLRHCGFHRAWWCLSEDIEEWLNIFPKDSEIILAGHSLGGALAQIAARQLSDRFRIRAVMSFGSSRIGGNANWENYKAPLANVMVHFAHAEDVIPRLPPIGLFCHVGKSIALGGDGIRKDSIFESLLPTLNGQMRSTPEVQFQPAVLSSNKPAAFLHGDIVPKQAFSRHSNLQPFLSFLEPVIVMFLGANGKEALFYLGRLGKRMSEDHGAGIYRDALAVQLMVLESFKAQADQTSGVLAIAAQSEPIVLLKPDAPPQSSLASTLLSTSGLLWITQPLLLGSEFLTRKAVGTKSRKRKQGILRNSIGILVGIICLVALISHIYVCWVQNLWTLLLTGAIISPVAVIHGLSFLQPYLPLP